MKAGESPVATDEGGVMKRQVVALVAVAFLAASAPAQPRQAVVTTPPSVIITPGPVQAVQQKYQSLGGSGGFLGAAVSPISTAPGDIAWQHYANGSIFYSPATGAHEVHGLIKEKWVSLKGANGFLGFPLTDELATPDGVGRYNHFQGGSVYWTPSTGAHEVHGAIRSKWSSLGWERGFLGYPLTDEMTTPDGKGKYTHFQGGSIYWTSATGAHEVHGLIRERWAALGWEKSFLGYPLTDELVTPGFGGYGRYSKFQGGAIYYAPDAGAVEVRDLAGEIISRKLWPSLGRRKVLVILWDPLRAGHAAPAKGDVDNLLFGAANSVADWYRENSGGKFALERAGVLGWYRANKPADHYWSENETTDSDGDGWLNGHMEKWAEAIRKADAEFDFKAHDKNANGVLEPSELAVLVVIPQNDAFGTRRGVVGRQAPSAEALKVDGVEIRDVVEWYTGSPLSLDLPAHELSHILMDTPDLYFQAGGRDLYWPYATQSFSLMCGIYQGRRTVGHFDPFIKLKSGWLNYTVAVGSGEYRLRDVERSGEALVLYDPRRNDDLRRPREYFIIENRWRGTSYDAGRGAEPGVPNDGLAVWHVVEDPALYAKMSPAPPNTDAAEWGRRGIRLIRADGGAPGGCVTVGPACVPNPADDAKALFRSYGATVSGGTSPASLRWLDGTSAGFEVTLLSLPGEEVRLSVNVSR
jgi:M6 family metalloprotease-like protein